jgi:hypothetical protein
MYRSGHTRGECEAWRGFSARPAQKCCPASREHVASSTQGSLSRCVARPSTVRSHGLVDEYGERGLALPRDEAEPRQRDAARQPGGSVIVSRRPRSARGGRSRGRPAPPSARGAGLLVSETCRRCRLSDRPGESPATCRAWPVGEHPERPVGLYGHATRSGADSLPQLVADEGFHRIAGLKTAV